MWQAWLTLPSCLASSSRPTLARMIFYSLVMTVFLVNAEAGRCAPRPLRARPRLMPQPIDTVCQIKFQLLHYMVQIPGTASRISLERMHETIGTRPNLRRLVFSYSDALLAQAFQTVACNAVHPVEARCRRWILSTRDRVDWDTLPLTHEFLAEMLGTQQSTVSTVLRTLQATGLIAQRRGCIVVTDRAGLERATCECYSRIRYQFEKLLPGTYAPPDHSRLTEPTKTVLLAPPAVRLRR